MTNTMKTAVVGDLEIGHAYNMVRATNAAGQPVLNIRRGDWRAVLITADNLARYTDGAYYFEPIKDRRYTPRLLAAGWTRFGSSRGECGAAITTPGPLFDLACEKPAYWATGGGPAMCAQHAAQQLA
jgi:hypothetical protein